jgi:hypothetical protein
LTIGIGLDPVSAAVIIGIGRVGRKELGVTMTDNNGAEENRNEDNADSTNTTNATKG